MSVRLIYLWCLGPCVYPIFNLFLRRIDWWRKKWWFAHNYEAVSKTCAKEREDSGIADTLSEVRLGRSNCSPCVDEYHNSHCSYCIHGIVNGQSMRIREENTQRHKLEIMDIAFSTETLLVM